MPRLRCDSLARLKSGDSVPLDRDEAKHLFHILRARPGDPVQLIDGAGWTGNAVVEEGKVLRLESVAEVPPPQRRIHLYIAPPRRQKMDQILREATELGVFRIVPVLCERSVALPDSELADRRKDLLFEACKQSGNAFLPRLTPPMLFRNAVPDAVQNCKALFFGSPYEAENEVSTMPDDVAFFVGPEGGFSGQEEQSLRDSGARAMRIGPWILRVETAAVAGIARLWAGK